jgi:catechol 2,3-dioxygenase-like lactoylglutathione lyase family enzyme
MSAQLIALTFDAHDPQRLGRFWAGFLGRDRVDEPGGGVTLLTNGWGERGDPGDGAGFHLRFLPSPEPKRGPNQMHFDLTSTSPQDQRDQVARALELGARHLDIGQGEVDHVVLADPDGNEFDVIAPGNRFLAECGLIGALAGDGSQAAGYFWSRALDWPLVWDQDEETAIRSPRGGPKITWGGPPLKEKTGRERLHFDLAPPAGGDHRAEAERLVGLGATREETGPQDGDRIVLADPDGHEFCVLPDSVTGCPGWGAQTA